MGFGDFTLKFSWTCSGITKGLISAAYPHPEFPKGPPPPHPGPWHSIASPVNRTHLHKRFTDNNTPVIFNSHLLTCISQLEDNEIILSIQASRASVSCVVRRRHLGTENEHPKSWMAAVCLSPLREHWYYLLLSSNIRVKGDKMKRENNPIRLPLDT